KLFNADGTENKTGELQYYADLPVRTGQDTTRMRFFLMDLGKTHIILGYPWFIKTQPRIDWGKGRIDQTQLPVIIRMEDTGLLRPVPRWKNVPHPIRKPTYYMGRVTIAPENPIPEDLSGIPEEYRRHLSPAYPPSATTCRWDEYSLCRLRLVDTLLVPGVRGMNL
ncbi:hypothetical protein BC826DRAFT_927689, partial [Russula brevipes]